MLARGNVKLRGNSDNQLSGVPLRVQVLGYVPTAGAGEVLGAMLR